MGKLEKPSVQTPFLDQLETFRTSFQALIARRRAELAEEAQRIASFAAALVKNRANLIEFCEHPAWSGLSKRAKPSQFQSKKVQYFLFVFACGLDESGRKNASFYNRVVETLQSEGVATDKLAEEIQRQGGFRAIADRTGGNVLPQSHRSEDATSKAEDSIDEDEGDAEDEDEDEDGEGATVRGPSRGDRKLDDDERVKRAAETAAVDAGMLLIDVSPKLLAELTSFDIDRKLNVWLKCVSIESDGFRRFTAKQVRSRRR